MAPVRTTTCATRTRAPGRTAGTASLGCSFGGSGACFAPRYSGVCGCSSGLSTCSGRCTITRLDPDADRNRVAQAFIAAALLLSSRERP